MVGWLAEVEGGVVVRIDMIDSSKRAPYLTSLKEGQRPLRTLKEGLNISELKLEVGL